jgi:uncharacterized protein (DUF302 family)
MFYVIDSDKTFDQAANDLEGAVKNCGFGILHIHDLGETLRKKGVDLDGNCRIFEVCNPMQAAKVLAVDMRLNMALPCRISVFTESGQTKLGLIKPAQMLAALSSDEALYKIAQEVESKTIQMIDLAS